MVLAEIGHGNEVRRSGLVNVVGPQHPAILSSGSSGVSSRPAGAVSFLGEGTPRGVFTSEQTRIGCSNSKTFCHSEATGRGRSAVKLIAEYLERALEFERFADLEDNPRLKADLQKQAAAYRKLAAERSKKLGLKPPPDRGV